MKCTICKHGVTSEGAVTVTLQRGDSIIIIKKVPAQVCGECGEYFLDANVASKVYAQADDAIGRHAEVEILRYAA
jgi:YgiT-type zinc finger domain-containing protein